MTAKKKPAPKVTPAEASAAAKVLETRKEQMDDPEMIAEAPVGKSVTCGDCDAVLPLGTEFCPNCGYEL